MSDADKRPERDDAGRLLPGHGVRSPGRPALPDWFKAKGPDALQVLVDVMTGAREDARVSPAQAAQVVMERVYGKAPPALEGDDVTVTAAAAALVLLAQKKPKEGE